MKRMSLLFKFWTAIMLMGLICTSAVNGQVTLKHSYTFEDSTAVDTVGGADGVLHGDAVVENGSLTLSGTGFVSLPAKQINIPSYESITVESVFSQAYQLSGWRSLFIFGETNPDVDWMGINYFMFQPSREDGFTRTAICTGNTSNPWATETVVDYSPQISDSAMYHVVSIVTQTEVMMYIDGKLIGTTLLADEGHSLDSVSADTAYIGASVYTSDPYWMGEIHELNIYEGIMDQATVVQHAKEWLGDVVSDATLDSLSTDKGPVTPDFDPEILDYEISVPFGTATVRIDAVANVELATIMMIDGLGDTIPASGVAKVPIVGNDIIITVTALDGTTQKDYYLSINPDPADEVSNLIDITLSSGSFTQEFHQDTTEYQAILPYGTTSVDVTGVPAWQGETVEGDGTITLTDGVGSCTINVTSEDGNNTKEYKVNLYASKVTTGHYYFIVHESSGYVMGGSHKTDDQPRLYNALRNDSTQLFEFVPSGVTNQVFIKNLVPSYLTKDVRSTNVWDTRWVGELTDDLDSCRFILHEYEPGRFYIETVILSDVDYKHLGTNDANLGTEIYNDKLIGDSRWPTEMIWNILPPEEVVDPYDTYLSDLSIDPGHLSPTFDLFTSDYYVTLPPGTPSITVSAVARDATSMISGTGTIDVSAGQGTTVITVTAPDPSYTREYKIHYLYNTALTLKHSYTFADGTAQDQVGTAHGTVHGGSISEGIYLTSVNGDHISLPGEEIAINTYPSITLEMYMADVDSTTHASADLMVGYFGNTSGSFGTDYYFVSPRSRTAVSCKNTGNPWATESVVNSTNLIDDGVAHHLVSVLNYDSVSFYIDGLPAGSALMSDVNKIYNLSNTYAYICKSGYVNDLTWLGQVLEYNIYSGEMDAQTIANRAFIYPLEDATTDATLSDLRVNDTTIADFASTNLNYTVILPKGTTEVPTVTAVAKIENATAVVTDATELPGTATVLVTAADGTTTVTYTVKFKIQANVEATLSDLTVDGTTIDGFESDKFSYTVTLQQGTTIVPTVVGTAADTLATVKVTPAASLPGTTTVLVTAEDGETTETYYVNFDLETSVWTQEIFTVKVYPTVSAGNFIVETSGGFSTISVYDISGKVVLKRKLEASTQTFNVPHAGMYIVRVESDGAAKTVKVFKTQ